MAIRQASFDSLVNSVVGAGTHFRGDLELAGLLRIDGDYSGTIRTSGKVIIGSSGRADCTIEASVVVIGGIFKGEIYCTANVIVLASAIVIGNLYSPRMVAEEGTLIHGSCVVTGIEAFEKRRRELSAQGAGDRFNRTLFQPIETGSLTGENPFANQRKSSTSPESFDPDARPVYSESEGTG